MAYFRLLPEVEARLHDLSRLIPPVTGATVATPPTTPFAVNQRARVRSSLSFRPSTRWTTTRS